MGEEKEIKSGLMSLPQCLYVCLMLFVFMFLYPPPQLTSYPISVKLKYVLMHSGSTKIAQFISNATCRTRKIEAEASLATLT